jgi:putative FmdB family regulatory protein
MPTYDYECTSCGYTFEVFQSMSDDPLKKCPECGKKVQRLIGGGVGIIFKGSGFYVTDSKKSSSGSTSVSNEEKKKPDDSKTPASDTKNGAKEPKETKEKKKSA